MNAIEIAKKRIINKLDKLAESPTFAENSATTAEFMSLLDQYNTILMQESKMLSKQDEIKALKQINP